MNPEVFERCRFRDCFAPAVWVYRHPDAEQERSYCETHAWLMIPTPPGAEGEADAIRRGGTALREAFLNGELAWPPPDYGTRGLVEWEDTAARVVLRSCHSARAGDVQKLREARVLMSDARQLIETSEAGERMSQKLGKFIEETGAVV